MDPIDYICFKCAHYGKPNGIGCRAFPEGIPYGYLPDNMHGKILKGQTGNYIFEPDPAWLVRVQLDGPEYYIYTSHCTKCALFDSRLCICAAFPWGIPEKYLITSELHSKPEPGQVGEYVFTPKI